MSRINWKISMKYLLNQFPKIIVFAGFNLIFISSLGCIQLFPCSPFSRRRWPSCPKCRSAVSWHRSPRQLLVRGWCLKSHILQNRDFSLPETRNAPILRTKWLKLCSLMDVRAFFSSSAKSTSRARCAHFEGPRPATTCPSDLGFSPLAAM